MPDASQKCMIVNVGHNIEPILPPESPYEDAPAYTCPRCDQTFSEPHPTRMNWNSQVCAFDVFRRFDHDRFPRGLKRP